MKGEGVPVRAFGVVSIILRIIRLAAFSEMIKGPLLLTFLGFATLSFGQSQDKYEVIRIDTDFVKVPVSVMDRDSRYVAGLKKADFKILENGVDQEISIFESTEAPFTIMLLADVSGSMIEYMPQLGRAIDAFIDQLRPDDTFVVAFFSAESKIIIRIPPVKKKDYRYVAPPPPVTRSMGSSFTMTFDAVDDAMKYMRRIGGRRAIVLFGDGDQSGRKATMKDNLRDAEEGDSIFYTIRYGEYPGACIVDNLNTALQDHSNQRDEIDIITKRDLRRLGSQGCYYQKNELPKLIQRVNAHFLGLAEKTGGRGYKINEVKDLAGTFEQIITELGQQYTLGYKPTPPGGDGERRKIKVLVNIPNVAVRSRNEVVYKKTKD